VARTINGRPSYLYADPLVSARQTATDQQIRAILSTAPLPGEEGLL